MAVSKQSNVKRAARGQRTRMKPEERREMIAREGASLVARYGMYGFSMNALADAVGLTVPGLTHYVKDREELCTLIIEVCYDKPTDAGFISGILLENARIEGTDEYSLPRYMRNVIEENGERVEMYRLFMELQIEAHDEDHPAHEYFRDRHAQILQSMLDRPWRLPERYRDDRELLIHLIKACFMAMDGAQLHSLTSPDENLGDFWAHAEAILFPSPEWDGCW